MSPDATIHLSHRRVVPINDPVRVASNEKRPVGRYSRENDEQADAEPTMIEEQEEKFADVRIVGASKKQTSVKLPKGQYEKINGSSDRVASHLSVNMKS